MFHASITRLVHDGNGWHMICSYNYMIRCLLRSVPVQLMGMIWWQLSFNLSV